MADTYVKNNRDTVNQGRWAEQTAHIHTMVAKATGEMPQHHRALVLGPGNAQEIPLRYLVDHYRTVDLLDVDGEAVRAAAQRQDVTADRVNIIERDISGLHDQVTTLLHRKSVKALMEWIEQTVNGSTSQSIEHWPAELTNYDLVITSLITSQLVSPLIHEWPLFSQYLNRLAEPAAAIAEYAGEDHARLVQYVLTRSGRAVVALDTVDTWAWSRLRPIPCEVEAATTIVQEMMNRGVRVTQPGTRGFLTVWDNRGLMHDPLLWMWSPNDAGCYLVNGFVGSLRVDTEA